MSGRVSRARQGHVQQVVLPFATELLIQMCCRIGQVVHVEEVAQIEMGSSPSGVSCNESGEGTPLLGGPADLGLFLPEAKRWTTTPTKLCAKDDILICVRATIGEPRWSDGVYCVGRGLAFVRPKGNSTSRDFLFHVLEGNQSQLRSKGTGTTFKTVSKSDLATLPFPVVPMEIQDSIGRFLQWLAHHSDSRVDWSQAPVLPPQLQSQGRVVVRIEELAAQIHEARSLHLQSTEEIDGLFISKLRAVVQECGSQSRNLPFTDITTLERRPVNVVLDQHYREIGVYCFSKGIFHKPPRTGADVGGKDLYEIRAGDFILQITFAWEGAVALAGKTEDGLFGSVRYLTFRVNEEICSPRYLLTYMKTPEAIAQLAKISPGSAGRNRVLSVKRLKEVLVPVVPLDAQKWLNDELQAAVDALRGLQAETAAELDALLPAILDRAFRGEL